MPNHITNQITFGSDSASLAAFQKMLRDMRMEGQPLGSIDFNKLLPMPKELNMESGTQTERGLELVQGYHDMLYKLERQKVLMSPESHAERLRQCEGLYRKKRMADPETWALGEQAYRNLQRFGSPTWYEWCNQNWGTKWNAYDCRQLREDSNTMVFFTAWSAVPRIVELLSKEYPEQTITYRWADEDIGHNVGESTLKGGKVVDSNIPADGSREAYEMAAEIMGVDLSDFNLCLTGDGTSYEYRDPDTPSVEQPTRRSNGQKKHPSRTTGKDR